MRFALYGTQLKRVTIDTKVLVCDIDNTLLNTRPRVRRCLEAIGRGEVFEQSPRTYGGFKDMLSAAEIRCFFQCFLSETYLDFDHPLPNAAATLHAWIEAGKRLIYLTGRHDAPGDSMRAGTETWLADHGYPVPDGHTLPLIMKSGRNQNDRSYKQASLSTLGPFPPCSFGLGDLPHEGLMYARVGLNPVLVSEVGLFTWQELTKSYPDVYVAENWKDVSEYVQNAAC